MATASCTGRGSPAARSRALWISVASVVLFSNLVATHPSNYPELIDVKIAKQEGTWLKQCGNVVGHCDFVIRSESRTDDVATASSDVPEKVYTLDKIGNRACDSADCETLDFSGLQLDHVAPGIFDNMPILKSLDLSRNRFNHIPFTVAHAASTYLELLDMSEQESMDSSFTIPPDTFQLSAKLRVVLLRSNKISMDCSGACNFPNFQYLPNLEIVDLTNNSLRYIPDGAFTGLPNLRAVFLGGNPIQEIACNAFTDAGSRNHTIAFDCDRQRMEQNDANIDCELPEWISSRAQIYSTEGPGSLMVFDNTSLIRFPDRFLDEIAPNFDIISMYSTPMSSSGPSCVPLDFDTSEARYILDFENPQILNRTGMEPFPLCATCSGCNKMDEDRICDALEDANFCPQDCGLCGDGFCSVIESEVSCSTDCIDCGNGLCGLSENERICEADCSECGNDFCGSQEDYLTCPQDCEFCGNSNCAVGEDDQNCPQDCALYIQECGLEPGDCVFVLIENLNGLGNFLSRIGSGSCTSDQCDSLHFENLNIEAVLDDQRIFNNMPQLSSLSLSGNSLSSWPRAVTSVLPQLETLDMSSQYSLNGGFTIPDAFHDLRKLKYLNLTEAGITYLPPIRKLPNLHEFYASSNFLSTIGDGSFRELPQLSVLDLYDNRITGISCKAFYDVGYNNSVAKESLGHPSYINFGANFLTKIPDSLLTLAKDFEPEYLGWMENPTLSCLAANFSQHSQLSAWDFEGTNMLHDDLTSFPVCASCSTCGNGVCSVGEDEGSCLQDCLPKCGNFVCGASEVNNCPKDCEVMAVINECGNFNAGGGHCNYILTPNHVTGGLILDRTGACLNNTICNQLKFDVSTVFVYAGPEDTIDKVADGIFKDMPQLDTLDLYNNYLTSVPKAVIDVLPQLKYLDLGREPANNPDGVEPPPFTVPPMLFQDLPKLTTIYLDHVNLFAPPKFKNLPKLEYISIYGNEKMTYIPDGTFDNLPNLMELYSGSENGGVEEIACKAFVNKIGTNVTFTSAGDPIERTIDFNAPHLQRFPDTLVAVANNFDHVLVPFQVSCLPAGFLKSPNAAKFTLDIPSTGLPECAPCSNCGNGVCELNEDESFCRSDCGPVCGNGYCGPLEDEVSCQRDCASYDTFIEVKSCGYSSGRCDLIVLDENSVPGTEGKRRLVRVGKSLNKTAICTSTARCDMVCDNPACSLLDFSELDIHEVEGTVFDSMPQLKRLALAYNNLNSVPVAVARVIPQLEELDLSAQKFDVFQEYYMEFLLMNEGVVLPDVAQKDFFQIPPNLFVNLPKLRYLALNALLLDEQPKLVDLPKLEVFHQAVSTVPYISDGAFKNLPMLESLDASGSWYLREISCKAFVGDIGGSNAKASGGLLLPGVWEGLLEDLPRPHINFGYIGSVELSNHLTRIPDSFVALAKANNFKSLSFDLQAPPTCLPIGLLNSSAQNVIDFGGDVSQDEYAVCAPCQACGDGTCKVGEDESFCPSDCKNVCRNGICGVREQCDSDCKFYEVVMECGTSRKSTSVCNFVSMYDDNVGEYTLLDRIGNGPCNNSECTEIHLDSYDWSHFADHIFDGIPQLRVLDIDYNDLRSMPRAVIDVLPQLVTLDMSDQRTHFATPSDVFQNLPNLAELYLDDMYMDQIPRFRNLPNLRILDLDGNPFATIPEGTFVNLPAVMYLDMGSSNIEHIACNAFDGFGDSNRVTNESDPYFDSHYNQPGNTEISLGYTLLSRFPDSFYKATANFERINMYSSRDKHTGRGYNTEFSCFPAGFFKHANLDAFGIAWDTEYDRFDVDDLSELEILMPICASCLDCGDKVCGLGEDEGNCPQDCVQECGNGICGQRENMTSCPQDCDVCGDYVCGETENELSCDMDCDEVCGNGVCGWGEYDSESCHEDCPGYVFFSCGPYDLYGHCDFVKVYDDYSGGFNLTRVGDACECEEIWVKQEAIHNIAPGTFDNIPNLKYLDLSYNLFSKLPQAVADVLPQLVELDFSWQYGVIVDGEAFDDSSMDVFQDLPKLEFLDIEFVGLRKLPTFRNLPRLQGLYASLNPVKRIGDGTFEDLPRLQYLQMNAMGDFMNMYEFTLQRISCNAFGNRVGSQNHLNGDDGFSFISFEDNPAMRQFPDALVDVAREFQSISFRYSGYYYPEEIIHECIPASYSTNDVWNRLAFSFSEGAPACAPCSDCNDDYCSDMEDEDFCPNDCAICGNGHCGAAEERETCYADCKITPTDTDISISVIRSGCSLILLPFEGSDSYSGFPEYLLHSHEDGEASCADLTELDVSHLNISDIHASFFYGLDSLTALHLHNNRLITMPEALAELIRSDRLELLDLERQNGFANPKPVHKLPMVFPGDLFQNLNNLKELWLAGLGMKELPMFFNLPALENLFLTGNEFRYIYDNNFIDLPSLDHLALDLNHIKGIHCNAFSNVGVGTGGFDFDFWADKNPEYAELWTQQTIDLTDNELQNFPSSFYTTTYGANVYFGSNKWLTCLPDDFLGFPGEDDANTGGIHLSGWDVERGVNKICPACPCYLTGRFSRCEATTEEAPVSDEPAVSVARRQTDQSCTCTTPEDLAPTPQSAEDTLGIPRWGASPKYENCTLDRGVTGFWKQPGNTASSLGRYAEMHHFETKVCVKGHECAKREGAHSFCFVYDMIDNKFVPWTTSDVLDMSKRDCPAYL